MFEELEMEIMINVDDDHAIFTKIKGRSDRCD
jgi:hypothetical protein